MKNAEYNLSNLLGSLSELVDEMDLEIVSVSFA